MKKDLRAIVGFLYEAGTLRKTARSHRQTLLEDDLSDNIASHSFRVTLIGWHLAQLEGADPYKVVMMCLLHDIPEARSGDHNWIHKKYTKVFDDEIIKDQFGKSSPNTELLPIVREYEARKTLEAKLAKDADLIDQVLLLREYEHKGNKEAKEWLKGKTEGKRYFSKSAVKLIKEIIKQEPSDWWNNIWTNKNR